MWKNEKVESSSPLLLNFGCPQYRCCNLAKSCLPAWSSAPWRIFVILSLPCNCACLYMTAKHSYGQLMTENLVPSRPAPAQGRCPKRSALLITGYTCFSLLRKWHLKLCFLPTYKTLFKAIFCTMFFHPSLFVWCKSWEIVMELGCGLALVLMGGTWGITMPSLKHLFSSCKHPWLSAVKSLAGKIHKAQGGQGKEKQLLGKQQRAPWDRRALPGHGRAEWEHVHLIERAFSGSLLFHCQIALEPTEHRTTCPPGFLVIIRVYNADLTPGCDVAAGAQHFISLQLLLTDTKCISWISCISLLRSQAAASHPAKENREMLPLEVALFMTMERQVLALCKRRALVPWLLSFNHQQHVRLRNPGTAHEFIHLM